MYKSMMASSHLYYLDKSIPSIGHLLETRKIPYTHFQPASVQFTIENKVKKRNQKRKKNLKMHLLDLITWSCYCCCYYLPDGIHRRSSPITSAVKQYLILFSPSHNSQIHKSINIIIPPCTVYNNNTTL